MFEVKDGPGVTDREERVPSGPDIEVKVSGRRGRESRWIRAGTPADVMRVLKAARDRSDLSNRQIAKELGISQASVSELIKGRKHPSVVLIVRWLGACGWDLMAVER